MPLPISDIFTPGVGAGLEAAATMLKLLFGGEDDTDSERFQAEMQAHAQRMSATTSQVSQASGQVQQAVQSAQAGEAQAQNTLGSSLQRFFM